MLSCDGCNFNNETVRSNPISRIWSEISNLVCFAKIGMVLVGLLWVKLMVNTIMITSILFLSGSCQLLIYPTRVVAWNLALLEVLETFFLFL